MTYLFQIQAAIEPNKRHKIPADSFINLIKKSSHLKATEAQQLVERMLAGQQIKLRLQDSYDAQANFAFVHEANSLGLSCQVKCQVLNINLPYLINQTGIIPDSEKIDERELSATDIERLIHQPTIQIVVTGYGYGMQWIPDREKYQFWSQKVRPQLIDYQNSQHRNDYPLYTATEWIAKSGQSYIFLWTLH